MVKFICTCSPPLSNMAASSRVYFGLLVSLTALASTDNAFGTALAVQHVVGNDQGWDLSSNLAAWSINRLFRVGDEICRTLFFSFFFFVVVVPRNSVFDQAMHAI